MNNSKFAIDSVSLNLEDPVSHEPKLRERETQLVRILTALQEVQQNKHWSSLKTELFDNLVNNLEHRLSAEAKKEIPDTNKLNRLAGELKWAERYSDLHKLEKQFREELTLIKTTLHGTTSEKS